jgi:hypothetical protein
MDFLTIRKAENALSDLPGQFEWLFISFVFGLRPFETDELTDRRKWEILFDSSIELNVLKISQSKLVGVSEDERWKFIPVILPEQERAIEFIKIGKLKRPLNKVLRSRLAVEGLESYSGRKGFTDWMLSKGYSIEDIASWLGHKSIQTTWKSYKDKSRVSVNSIKKKVTIKSS